MQQRSEAGDRARAPHWHAEAAQRRGDLPLRDGARAVRIKAPARARMLLLHEPFEARLVA